MVDDDAVPAPVIGSVQQDWTDPAPVPIQTDDVITTRAYFSMVEERDERKARRAAETDIRKHFMKMQLRVLTGVGLVFLGTILTLVIGLWRHLMPLSFANELMRMVVPTVLGAGLTIVGAFFHNGGNRSQ